MSAARFTAIGCLLVLLGGCAAVNGVRKLWYGSAPAQQAPAPTRRLRLQIEGLNEAQEANVRAYLGLADETCDAPRWRIEGAMRSLDSQVDRALSALGYYHPSIERRALHRADGCWVLDLAVEPGPPVRIARLDLSIVGPGATEKAFSALLAHPPLERGQVLDQGRYTQLKRAIENAAAARGYFRGRFLEHRLTVDVATNRAEVDLRYDTGPRFHFGAIAIHQQGLRERLLHRFLSLASGAPYSTAALARQNRELSDSGYFATVSVTPRLGRVHESGGPRTVPVDIFLTPRKRNSYTIGVGASTDTGPRIKLGYANHRLNRSGHRFSADTTLSPDDQQFHANYAIPLAHPLTEWLNLTAGVRSLKTATSTSTTESIGATRTGTRFGHWLETESLAFTHESFTVAGQPGSTLLVVPGLTLQRTVSDDPLNPTHGYSLFFDLHGAAKRLLSGVNFIQGRARAVAIESLPWRDRIILRAEAGTTITSDFNSLPASYRFFAGGENSVRGYAYQSLGPTNADGEVVGGRYLLVGSFEYDHHLFGPWSLAAFVDAGNAYNQFNQGLKVGAGTGVRWRSPVGPVRLDVAFPLSSSGSLLQIYLSFGPQL